MQRRTFLGISAAALAGALLPAAALPLAGKDYNAVSPAQPVETGAKIEVLEVFSYGCPHCYEFEPKLAGWLKSLPPDVAFRRLPVSFGRPQWESLARTYYALEAIGATAKVHSKVFEAIHAEGVNLAEKDVLFDWISKQGVDRKQFSDAWTSFGVAAKVGRLTQVAGAYGIEAVPTLVVDGKFRVSGAHDNMLRVTDDLIRLARSERGAAKK